MAQTEQIPEGYKMTKIGEVPIDWEISELSEVSLIKGDYGINAAAVDYDENLPKYLRITDIDSDGNFILEKPKSVDDENSKDFYLEEGDIVFARTGATVGKSYLHHKSNGKLVFAGFLIRFRLNTEILFPYFLKLFIKTNYYNNWIRVFSVRSGQPGINSKELGKLPIPLPPLPEQQKIASILSTWDKAIAKHETLINQKDHLKKGLMQELLTGKKRFAGFTEEWSFVKIKDIANTFSGGTPSSTNKDYYNGIIPWLKSGELNKGIIENTSGFISELGLNNSSAKIVKENTILVAMYGATAGVCAITKIEGAINQAVLAIELNKNYETYFVYQFLKMKMPKVVHSMVQGGQPNLSGGIINNLKFKLPNFKEQQKIANTLSSADKEIENLKTQLATMKLQKQGLMQELLTGKRRVKLN